MFKLLFNKLEQFYSSLKIFLVQAWDKQTYSFLNLILSLGLQPCQKPCSLLFHKVTFALGKKDSKTILS